MAVVVGAVVELPHVVVECRQHRSGHDPRGAVLRDRAPPFVVDPAVGEHLEVLQVVTLRCRGFVERVEHARAFHRRLQHPVDHRRLRQPGRFEDRRCDVDDMGELRPQPTLLLDPVGPVHDGPVAGAAPVRSDLLGPLERGAVRPRPPDGVVVVRARRTQLVELGDQELRGLERGHPVEVGHLVERPVDRPFGRGAVVADDVVDDRVVEDPEILDGVDQPADVMVGVLEETGVHLHLAGQHRLQLVGHVVPRRDLGMTNGQLGLRRDDPELLLAGQRGLPQRIPPIGELARVLVRPLLGDMVRSMGGARGEVDEERLVGHQRLLLTHPADRPISQILGQVIPLLRRRRRLHRCRPLVQGGIPLVVLTTDETVERLEPTTPRRPRIERTHR